MSRSHYVADLKLCLELLSRCEIYPDLQQLEHFLADEKHLELLNQCSLSIKTAWENSVAADLTTEQIPVALLNDSKPEITSATVVDLKKHTETADLSGYENTESLAEKTAEAEALRINQPQPLVRFKLPNATVGKNYQGQLEWTSPKPLTLLAINGLDKLGLCFDVASNIVAGEPEIAGEHTLSISYQQDDDSTQTIQTAQLTLVINSDPRSLWKNIPSDTAVPFWKADSHFAGKTGLANWKLVAASKRGRSHAHVGSCRDDDFALQVDNKSLWQILAVADGAGSSEFSRQGARIAAHNSVEILNSQLQQANPALDELIERWQVDKNTDNETALQRALVEIFSAALSSSIEMIQSLAKQQQISYRDFYSTLLIAAHKTFPKGEFIVAYWIGDGGLAVYNAGQAVELLGISDSGEYAGQTRFLDKNALEGDDLLKRLRFNSQKTFTALILMTDGITDPLFETDNNLRALGYWDKLWQQIQPKLEENPELSGQNLMEWLDFWSLGNHDDRTIALIYR